MGGGERGVVREGNLEGYEGVSEEESVTGRTREGRIRVEMDISWMMEELVKCEYV